MNILSTILYSDVATLAIMAGTEYCRSNFPIGAVPRVTGDEVEVDISNNGFYILRK